MSTPSIRAALAPAPPAPEPGEVGELAAWMRSQVAIAPAAQTQWAKRFLRCATLLAQQAAPAPAVVPVAVSERPWEREEWCDAEKRCWWGRPSEELCNSDWFLATRDEVEEFCSECMPIVSLPARAIPLPQAGEGEA